MARGSQPIYPSRMPGGMSVRVSSARMIVGVSSGGGHGDRAHVELAGPRDTGLIAHRCTAPSCVA